MSKASKFKSFRNLVRAIRCRSPCEFRSRCKHFSTAEPLNVNIGINLRDIPKRRNIHLNGDQACLAVVVGRKRSSRSSPEPHRADRNSLAIGRSVLEACAWFDVMNRKNENYFVAEEFGSVYWLDFSVSLSSLELGILFIIRHSMNGGSKWYMQTLNHVLQVESCFFVPNKRSWGLNMARVKCI